MSDKSSSLNSKIYVLSSFLLATFLTSSIHCKPSGNKIESVTATPGLSYLEQTSQAFSSIADQAIPATVFIKAENKVETSAYSDSAEEFFRRFFGAPRGQDEGQIRLSQGSGFIITSNGHILTNHHLVKDVAKITVVLHDGTEYPANVVGADQKTDLAIIKIEGKDLPTLDLGDSDALRIGEWVVAIGSPFQLQASLTKGVVSAKGRQDLGITSLEDFIQTDAVINPGNSGGPLLNLKGEVVGVNTAIFTRSGGYMGIGFAIPSNLARHVADQILASGTVQRAYLGIMMQPLDKELASELKLDPSEGIVITSIMEDSPAAKAGLKQNDVIIEFEGKKIQTLGNFRNKVALMAPGSQLNLTILRNNKRMKIAVTLSAWPEDESASEEMQENLGITVEPLTPEIAAKLGQPSTLKGVVISKVKPGSSAANIGLKPYFIITGVVQGWEVREIQNTADFNQALKDNRLKNHIILVVRHQNYQRYYTVKLNK